MENLTDVLKLVAERKVALDALEKQQSAAQAELDATEKQRAEAFARAGAAADALRAKKARLAALQQPGALNRAGRLAEALGQKLISGKAMLDLTRQKRRDLETVKTAALGQAEEAERAVAEADRMIALLEGAGGGSE